MAKYAGVQFTTFLVDGYNLIASLSEAVTLDKESLTQQTNAFGAISEEHTPLNVEKGAITVGGGFYDAATNALLGVFDAVRGIKRIICAGIEGNIIGQHFVGYEGVYDSKYVLQDVKDALTKANLNLLVSGNVDEGVIVQHLAAFTASQTPPTGDSPVDNILDQARSSKPIASNSVAAASVVTMRTEHGAPIAHGLINGDIIFISGVTASDPTINGQRTVTRISDTTFSVPVNVTTPGTGGSFVKASSHHGGVGYLQATAYSGFTGVIPSIMHSPDDSSYAALINFTSLAAIGKQRVVITGVVDRYLSSQIAVTGSGSITLFMGFARN